MPDPEQEHVRRRTAWEFAAGASDRVVGPPPIEGIRDVPPQAIPGPESLPPELRVTTAERASPSTNGSGGERWAERTTERIVEVPRPPARNEAPPPISEARAES